LQDDEAAQRCLSETGTDRKDGKTLNYCVHSAVLSDKKAHNLPLSANGHEIFRAMDYAAFWQG
jgi:hypothetical protein